MNQADMNQCLTLFKELGLDEETAKEALEDVRQWVKSIVKPPYRGIR